MKFMVLVCLVVVAIAAPQFQDSSPVVQVLVDERQDDAAGNFRYSLQADNGILMEASGTPGSQGQSNIQGSYWSPLPDGTFQEVRYVADEFGFRPQSSLLPTPPPLPAHVQDLLRIAEEQRAQGIVFE
ncbi:cuticle protein AM1159-like [Panulirus ornatus]|uniref:cuticle protein AM1159-like n=1 Tax=Panulirus ornatus TaxID=150431 RepID=UPI003A8C7522